MDDSTRIPQERVERDRLRSAVRRYVAETGLVPPLTLDELRDHASAVASRAGAHSDHADFLAVLVGNAAWQPVVAAIPRQRRVLLLPQCLRQRSRCPASLDEFGLLCEQCGTCATGALEAEAESLGTVVLVAEGTTMVTALISSGQVDGVIGVGCLESLERSFPHATEAAVPALAIPLTSDGCDGTEVDAEWVLEAIHLEDDAEWSGPVPLDELRVTVASWFEADALRELLDAGPSDTERIAREWLIAGGKRWRPTLTAAAYQAITGCDRLDTPALRRLAVASECFHKASLVHDDIEDGDERRYDRPTLHVQHGLPVALNVGDLLIGEGYRLIAECDAPAEARSRMLTVAARAHRELCLGQGEELSWMRDPGPLSVDRVLDIFRRKTAPAFEVALSLGAIAAEADQSVCEVLSRFSEAIGIAYQIRDDIEDAPGADCMQPSLLHALAMERDDRAEPDTTLSGAAVREMVADPAVAAAARQLLDHYRERALLALRPLEEYRLKSLLHRLTHAVLGGSTDPPRNATHRQEPTPHPDDGAAIDTTASTHG